MCSDLIPSVPLLDYIPLRQLALVENKVTVSLTITENMLGLRLLAIFGEVGSRGTSTRNLERWLLSNSTVFRVFS